MERVLQPWGQQLGVEHQKINNSLEVVPTSMRKLAAGSALCLPSPHGAESGPSGGGSSPVVCTQAPGRGRERGKSVSQGLGEVLNYPPRLMGSEDWSWHTKRNCSHQLVSGSWKLEKLKRASCFHYCELSACLPLSPSLPPPLFSPPPPPLFNPGSWQEFSEVKCVLS